MASFAYQVTNGAYQGKFAYQGTADAPVPAPLVRVGGGDPETRKKQRKDEDERRWLIQQLLTKAHEGELPEPLAAEVIAKATPYVEGKKVPERVLRELEAIAREEEDIEILVLH